MKISITGASGFVGRNLQNYLKDTHELQSLSVRYPLPFSFTLNTDVLVHLAGKAHDLKKVSDPKEYYESNFELSKQLFDAFISSEATVFIFMSTVKACADEVKGILTEEDFPNPQTHYGIAKHQAEEYILSKKIPNWKRVYILRPCLIHGPGNKGNLNLLYQLISKGIPWPLGGFYNQRSFLSIENLCFVVKELIENSKISSGVYQVADDGALSVNELVRLLEKSLNKKNKILKINPSLIRLGAKLGDFLYLPLNSERLQKLTENYVVSNNKIVEAMKKALPVKIEEGLLKTIEDFKNGFKE